MTLLLGFLILVAAPPGDTSPERHMPPHNFLKGAEARRRCGSPVNGEIVVCGGGDADEEFRVRPLPDVDKYRETPVRAEAAVLGDGKLGVHNEDKDVGGFRSKRAMVTLSLPFLRRRGTSGCTPGGRLLCLARTTGAPMTTFDDREAAFENKFAYDEEMAFRVAARRNRIAAAWAADQMGLRAEEAEAYASALIEADFEEAGDEDVVRKLVRDLAAAAVTVSETDIRAALAIASAEAQRQLSE